LPAWRHGHRRPAGLSSTQFGIFSDKLKSSAKKDELGPKPALIHIKAQGCFLARVSMQELLEFLRFAKGFLDHAGLE
jgi:hypothetical protein